MKKRAYHLWEDAGRPEGRDAEFWEQAKELIGMEENADATLLPNPMTDPTGAESRAEEAEIQANYGEFPNRFTDQGGRQQTPVRSRKKK